MPESRAGTCAIVGRPNVGKSTLMNRILGEKLAVVTPKPQTTRNRILGVKNRPGAQIVLLDTPGIHRAKSSLNQYMVDQALAALAGKPFDPGEGNRFILDKLAQVRRPRILAINKIDLLRDKTALLPLVDGYARALPFDDIVPISAATGDGVDRLEEAIAARLPVGPPLFPEEMFTDRAERFLAAELVREQTFALLAEELPYSVAVTIDSFVERATQKDVVIEAVVHVERDSQKKIVVGEGGRMIKEIGTRARAEIGKLLGCPVHLKLHVKVDPDWTRNGRALSRLGYE